MRRGITFVALAAMLLVAMAVPAGASRAPASGATVDGHKITICHATRSLSNPYVEITIDVAAWNNPTDRNHHGDNHTRTKNGVTWKDYILQAGECTLPPPQQLCPFAGTAADYVIDFGGVTKLYWSGDGAHLTKTVGVDIPAGTYDVTLISGDFDRGSTTSGAPLFQPHESWRLFGTPPSGYSNDLLDTILPLLHQVTSGLSVTFDEAIETATAEHWSVLNSSDRNANSVVPEFACLVGSRS